MVARLVQAALYIQMQAHPPGVCELGMHRIAIVALCVGMCGLKQWSVRSVQCIGIRAVNARRDTLGQSLATYQLYNTRIS